MVVLPVVLVPVFMTPVSEDPVVMLPVVLELLQVPSAFVLNMISPTLAKTTSPNTFFCSIIFVYIIKLFLPRVEFI
ncbi:MAG: hypothetical protein WCG98_07790 [bacterium]